MVELFGVMTGAAGAASIETTFGVETAEQFALPYMRTVYDPAADTMMERVVAPLDHAYEVPGVEVSVSKVPGHMLKEPLAVITGTTGAAIALTTIAAEVAEQPVLIPVTE